MTLEMCLEDLRQLFSNPNYKPDYLKIYPTLVVRDTLTYDMWRRGEYEPLTNEEAAEIVGEVMGMIPKYTRLQRVQRDIPADFIDAGVWKSNLRQLAQQYADDNEIECRDIRAREVGMNKTDPNVEDIELDVLTYEVCGGTEHFISFEDTVEDLLIGFCRLRFPNDPVRRELQNAAIVRELHVYGSEAGIGQQAGKQDWQHRGYGQTLLAHAEELAIDAGFDKLSVISGIGVREYYREKQGYIQDGPYVSKWL